MEFFTQGASLANDMLQSALNNGFIAETASSRHQRLYLRGTVLESLLQDGVLCNVSVCYN